MELTAAATLWCLFSMWLLFPYLLVPRILTTAAATLGWLEFISVLAWGFGSEECESPPCAVAETGRAAATIDLPALSLVVIALAVAHAIRRGRVSAGGEAAGARAGRRGPRYSSR